jgi:uncharacterized protein YxjI
VNSSVPTVLAFPDRRHEGRFPVTDQDGRVVARISARWSGTSFTVTDAGGRPLCAGTAGRWGLARSWRATGPDGRPLLSVTTSLMFTKAEVHIERGADFVVRGSAWRRDFAVTDVDGQTVLTAVPRTSSWSFRQHDYAVQQTRPVLDLAEVVALVQTWRMVRKNDAAAAGAAGAAGSTGAISS